MDIPNRNKFKSRGLAVILGCSLFLCGVIAGGGLIFLIPQIAAQQRPTPIPLIFPTRDSAATSFPDSATPTTTVSLQPAGKIVYVCQLYKATASDQICIMNADGSAQRRLTNNDSARHYYPSIAPDGRSVLFSSNMDGRFEIYEISLTGELKRFGQSGIAPEVSPDNRYIAFVQNDGQNDTIWLMDRDGQNPHQIYSPGWDPTWSPDGTRILFATYIKEKPQLMTIASDGSDPKQITNLPDLRGRSDWSNDGLHIITYSGQPWSRELFLMDSDGANPRQITPPGGNSQGPSFSPDGQWVAFTGYFDKYREINGCEIYIIKIDGTQLTRLTNNDYCDWQPRWGP